MNQETNTEIGLVDLFGGVQPLRKGKHAYEKNQHEKRAAVKAMYDREYTEARQKCKPGSGLMVDLEDIERKVAAQFFLSPATVRSMMKGWGGYRTP